MRFRLLLDPPRDGALNMALDETLLLRSASDEPLPTLRFYAWQPACLSLGRLQKALPPGALTDGRDYDVVRRPTGGRAVWHADEITYSISAPLAFLPAQARSVQGAYEWLSRGFMLGLQELGIALQLAPHQKGNAGSPNCFASSAACDFQVDGKKLIGAAQCRDEGAFMQHGSLLLRMDERAWEEKTGGPMNGATSLEALGISLNAAWVIQALCWGFTRATDAQLEAGGWSEEEWGIAQRLRRDKYANQAWTREGRAPDKTEDFARSVQAG